MPQMMPSGRPVDLESDVELALQLADLADRLALHHFSRGPDRRWKDDGTPVTEADLAIESVIRDALATHRPGDGILGEEMGERAGDGERRWVLDPIDGTARFLGGDPRFATLLALEIGTVPVVGVVSAPALSERWWGVRREGAVTRADGSERAASPSAAMSLAGARGLAVGSLRRGGALPGRPDTWHLAARIERTGAELRPAAASWETVRVADGAVDFAIGAGSWWDIVAPSVVAEAAGVRVVRTRSGSAERRSTGKDRAGVVLAAPGLAAELDRIVEDASDGHPGREPN